MRRMLSRKEFFQDTLRQQGKHNFYLPTKEVESIYSEFKLMLPETVHGKELKKSSF